MRNLLELHGEKSVRVAIPIEKITCVVERKNTSELNTFIETPWSVDGGWYVQEDYETVVEKLDGLLTSLIR